MVFFKNFLLILILLLITSMSTWLIQIVSYRFESLIFNLIGYLVVFILLSRFSPKRFFWLPFVCLTTTILIIRITDEGIDEMACFQIIYMFIGTVIGYFWRIKKYIGLFILAALSTLFLTYLRLFHFSKNITEKINPKHNIEMFNMNSRYLINHQGHHPVLHRDTVYLVNFSFLHCAPCRRKKKYMPKIKNQFKNKAFKIIEIHIYEDRKIFDNYYMLDNPYVYHDSLNKINSLFKIQGGPQELIFNKEGRIVRNFAGFYPEMADAYVQTTIKLIDKLLKE